MRRARIARTFGIEPRIAMLSFSNFGSVRHPEAEKMARAVQLLRQRDPSLDGRRRDAGRHRVRSERSCERDYPFSTLKEQANVLIFPNLSAGNIAYKLLNHLGGATAIGPILVGMSRPVHVLERGADVQDIVNMAAVAVVDAQERTQPESQLGPRTATPRADESTRGYRADGDSDEAATTTPSSCRARSGSRRRDSSPTGEVHWNLVAPELIQHAVAPRRRRVRRHGTVRRRHVAAHRPLAERQVRRQGAVVGGRRRLGQGQPAVHAREQFDTLLADVQRVPRTGATSCSSQDLYCGADPKYRLSVRYVSPNAWHMAFVRNMFIRPDASELPTFDPNFTVLHAPEFQADPAKHGTRTGTFIVLNLAQAHDPHRRHALRR